MKLARWRHRPTSHCLPRNRTRKWISFDIDTVFLLFFFCFFFFWFSLSLSLSLSLSPQFRSLVLEHAREHPLAPEMQLLCANCHNTGTPPPAPPATAATTTTTKRKQDQVRYGHFSTCVSFFFFFGFIMYALLSLTLSFSLSLFDRQGKRKKNHKIAWERGGKKRCTPTVTPAVPMLPTKYGDRNINPPEKKTRWKKKCFVRNKVVTEFCLVGPKLDFCIVPPPLHKKK